MQKEGQICWIQNVRMSEIESGRPTATDDDKKLIDNNAEIAPIRMNDGKGSKGNKHIFQLIPSRWKLFEYDTAGLLKRVTSYDEEMCRYKVLAWSQKEPIFLLTPYGKEYINELIIR